MIRAGVVLAALLVPFGALGQPLPATAPLPPSPAAPAPPVDPGDADGVPPYQPQIER